MIGQTINHYKITAKLGEGGMGVVYKAEDTKLDRPVALKFLADHLLQNDDARKRFRREAKAAAALRHPNVCPIHEITEADGRTFMVLAFIEGQSLDKRIESGPVPVPESLDIARQIARGLEAAHEKGIVHRDIKPANAIVDDKGHVTVMDFGLALLTAGSKLTELDTTLGTAAYMSPEQTQGMEVDHRTDIWALGGVLYEMVCGKPPFRGLYAQALLYEIVHQEPEPLTAQRTGVPMELERIVGKCLTKAAQRRYSTAADLIVDLENLADGLKERSATVMQAASGSVPPRPPPKHLRTRPRAATGTQAATDATAPGGALVPPSPGPDVPLTAEFVSTHDGSTAPKTTPRRALIPWLISAALLLALVAVSALHFTEAPPRPPVRRFSFTPPGLVLNRGGQSVSPNGRHIAYIAGADDLSLWVRDLDQEQARELSIAGGEQRPFWSTGSRFIGFASGGELKKISVDGGPATPLCPLPNGLFQGGTWSPDGESIVFGSGGPAKLYEVPARGGKAELLFEPERTEKGIGATGPHFLPLDPPARVVLYEIGGASDRDIALRDLATGEWELLTGGAYPSYSPSGHILYQTNRHEGGLWALPFSIATLKATGEAFPMAESQGAPSVAADETLVFADFSGGGTQQLGWRDSTGKKLGLVGQPQNYLRYPLLSPGTKRVAVTGQDGEGYDVWIHDLTRPIKTRLTFDPGWDGYPRWSPSGDEITFVSDRNPTRTFDIFKRPADGTGEAELLVGSPGNDFTGNWSVDEKHFVFSRRHSQSGYDLLYLERKAAGGEYDERVFLQTEFSEGTVRLSPDGRFVAYLSDEAGGQSNVYVRPFPEGGGKQRISPRGGRQHVWSRNGKTLFYVEGNTLIAVAVRPGTCLPWGRRSGSLNTQASVALPRRTTTSRSMASVSWSSRPSASRKKNRPPFALSKTGSKSTASRRLARSVRTHSDSAYLIHNADTEPRAQATSQG